VTALAGRLAAAGLVGAVVLAATPVPSAQGSG
jgi:hypothetical protein